MQQRRFHLAVPASTSNLGSGFDTLGLALKLHLTVTAVFGVDETCIQYSGEGADRIPADERNLLYRSYAYGCEKSGKTPLPVKMDIHNPIPLQRGLGSSGAAIAAGLMLAGIATGCLEETRLVQWGYELEGHPENVSASLMGGFTVSCLHNGRVLTTRTHPPEHLVAVALIPDVTIPTEQARRVLPKHISLQEAIFNMQRVALWVMAIQNNGFALMRAASEDRLHQPYRSRFIPGFDAILSASYDAGAHATFLSGSGSTILALCGQDRAGAVECAMADVARSHNLNCTTRILELEGQGARYSELE